MPDPPFPTAPDRLNVSQYVDSLARNAYRTGLADAAALNLERRFLAGAIQVSHPDEAMAILNRAADARQHLEQAGLTEKGEPR